MCSLDLRAALNSCTEQLERSGPDSVDAPRLSAELLLAKALGLDRDALLKRLILEPESPLPESAWLEFAKLTARRCAGEPAAYILGHKEFYGREFTVTPDTLIPRPETELLIDLALEYARSLGNAGGNTAPAPCFADFGTGTGCIAVTLALELLGWRGLALEKDPAALRVACANALRLGAADVTDPADAQKLRFILADFHAPPISLPPPASLDLLISNPPYVSEAEYRTISFEVRDFEPKSALVPGMPPGSSAPSSGLEDAEAIIDLARILLKPGGLLLMEIGHAQGPALLPRLQDWFDARLHKDLAGLDRVLIGKR